MGRGGILFGAAEESPTLIAVAIAAVIGTNPRAAAAAGTADGCGRIIEIVAIIQSNSGNNPSAAFPPPFRPQPATDTHTGIPQLFSASDANAGCHSRKDRGRRSGREATAPRHAMPMPRRRRPRRSRNCFAFVFLVAKGRRRGDGKGKRLG